jgi:tRNA (cmo5U34)-methyltransferase
MKFTFAKAAEGFDNHINKSIRGYSYLIDDIAKLAHYFIQDGLACVDVGCSTGKLLKKLYEGSTYAPAASFVGVEIESDFYDSLDLIEEDRLIFHKGDVLQFDFPKSSLIISLFTLQFMREIDREIVLRKIYNSLSPGGAFIFAEKLVLNTARTQDIVNSIYYEFKLQSFTSEEILNKEHELRHMLKPNTREEILSSVESAGFDISKLNSFWQNHMFTAFIIIK